MIWRNMLSTDSKSSQLYQDVLSIVSPMGYELVEASRSEHQGYTQMRVLLSRRDGDITTDDLESVYNVIYPRYQVIIGRNLELEVSSPGLTRVFKDVLEFGVFQGREARIYSMSLSSYVIGRIASSSDASVVLSSYLIEDRNERGDEIEIPFSDISKAKLEYSWEASR